MCTDLLSSAELYQSNSLLLWGDYFYSLQNGTATIIAYRGVGGAVTLPATIDGFPVTSVDNNAFYGNTSLTSMTIPASVTSIGNQAFSGCSGLTRVSLPERFLTDIEYIGLSGQVAATALITGISNNLASNNSFVTGFISTVLSKSGNYGLATKTDLDALSSNAVFVAALVNNSTFMAAMVNNPAFMAALAKQIVAGPNNYGISIKQNPSLSFPAIPAQTYVANKTLTLAATSSAKLTPITYLSSNTAVATVAGNILTIKQAGVATITASQAGDATNNPATAVQNLTVNKITQTLSFAAIPSQTYVANKKVTLAATSSAVLTPIVYTSANTAVATVSGNIITLTGKGSTTITASQVGNVNYTPATAVQVLTVK